MHADCVMTTDGSAPVCSDECFVLFCNSAAAKSNEIEENGAENDDNADDGK